MANALLPTEPTQTHRGGGARFFRRLGGAVRGAIAGGIEIVSGHRRPAAAKPSRTPRKPRDPAAPSRPRRPHQPRTTAPDQPAKRRGWFARWFGPSQRQAEQAAPVQADAPTRQPRPARKKDKLFSPETHPGLTQEDCDFLNTPLGQCDPEKLRVLADALSQQIAAVMGPGLGMDADALFSTFCERLFISQGAAAPDAPPSEEPSPAPDTARAAAPDAPADPPCPPSRTTGPVPDPAMIDAAAVSAPKREPS